MATIHGEPTSSLPEHREQPVQTCLKVEGPNKICMKQQNKLLHAAIQEFGLPQALTTQTDDKKQQAAYTAAGAIYMEAELPDTVRTASSASRVTAELAPPLLVSKGSIGHPEFCKRPCIYMMQGVCNNGKECGFCHHAKHASRAHLDKHTRSLIRSMSFEDLLTLVSQLILERAQETGMLREVAPMVLALRQLPASGSASSSTCLDRLAMRKIRLSLRKLSIARLISVLRTHASRLDVHADLTRQLVSVSTMMPQDQRYHDDAPLHEDPRPALPSCPTIRSRMIYDQRSHAGSVSGSGEHDALGTILWSI
eukprot:TRINITY_DN7300_c0_g1_i3.p1 TRINITY_DN7300_c0_g1~~TRINITY_DN7300_c0_g1_i3.p1  ORF type:complete len:326 (+),score=33.51 TRINITY_DN7300_c0_g1_i3:51-980(+)